MRAEIMRIPWDYIVLKVVNTNLMNPETCVNSERISGSQLRKVTARHTSPRHCPILHILPHNHDQGCAIDYQIILPAIYM